MKIENLYDGQVFKNYKHLCAELEMMVKTGKDSKNAQFKELERYCNFVKDGHKIMIKEVYDIPKEKVDGRGKSEGSRRSLYGNGVQLLITDLLAQSEGNISISKSKLWVSIGMVNVNYGVCGQHVKKLSRYMEMDEKVIYDFYNINNSNFSSIVESALNGLENKRIILYNKVIKVALKGRYSKPRKATESELSQILRYEKKVLEEMGYKQISDVRLSKKWKEYQKKIKKLLEENTNINHYYPAYEITVNKDFIEQERNELADLLLEQVLREETKTNLNSTLIEYIIKNAEKRKKKGFTSGRMAKVRLGGRYIEDIKKLTSLLIDRNKSNIISNVQNVKINTLELPKELLDEIELADLFG